MEKGVRLNHFIDRTLKKSLLDMIGWFPVVSLTGPRQSGKSTLAKEVFADYTYINLEDPQIRRQALEDPVGFIRNRESHLIIDEAQYAPELFSMIQVASDERGKPGQYVLAGSQNFLMMKHIGQSLAGRVGILKLLPLSFYELQQHFTADILNLDDFTLKGGYPRLYDLDIPPKAFFPSYIDTYVERDVAQLFGVRNKSSFRKMLTICAQNAGNLLNIHSLSRDVGVSVPTTRDWLSMLESSYLTFTLAPYHANVKKRLTKTPKLYFYDTGLLCHLLKIETIGQLLNSPSFGAVFENLLVAETAKRYINSGEEPELYFYRDDSKREIDLLDFTDSDNVRAVEIKSSQTYHDKYKRHLCSVGDELGIDPNNRFVVARVESSYKTKGCKILTARDWLLN